MTEPGHAPVRPWLAGLLVLVLLIAGVGRGWAVASEMPDAAPRIAGIVAPICHGSGGESGHTGAHDCCDACALCAPASLPSTPGWTRPLQVIRVATHDVAIAWAPLLVRPRSPRLAQGPPRLT